MFGLSTKRMTGALIAASGAVMALGSVASAEDFHPPDWSKYQRQTPYTTVQAWDFDASNSFAPDEDITPGTDGNYYNEGKANDLPYFTPGGTANYDGNWYGGNEGGYLDFTCPNWIDQFDTKWLWIQISGSAPVTGGPGGAPYVVGIHGYKGGVQTQDGVPQDDGTGGTGQHWEWWEMHPNPDWEIIRIYIPAGGYLSEVVIDTISFPAPGALGAFGVAGLVAMRRRR